MVNTLHYETIYLFVESLFLRRPSFKRGRKKRHNTYRTHIYILYVASLAQDPRASIICPMEEFPMEPGSSTEPPGNGAMRSGEVRAMMATSPGKKPGQKSLLPMRMKSNGHQGSMGTTAGMSSVIQARKTTQHHGTMPLSKASGCGMMDGGELNKHSCLAGFMCKATLTGG